MAGKNSCLLFDFTEDDSEESDFFASSSSSSSSSSSEDNFADVCDLLQAKTQTRRKQLTRIKLYVEKTVPGYTSEQFKAHFRMYPATFEYILSLIGQRISYTKYYGGRRPVAPEKQLLLAIWVMATPDSYRSICEKFDVGKATAIRTIRRVSYALHCLAPQVIQWPKGEEAVKVMSKFERHSAFPNVVGAIDGTHIKINKPSEDGKSYINRKGYASIQVQVVCTHDLLFTSVFAGNTGSVHDARVFRTSPVQGYLGDPEYFPEDSHLIGDAAYGIHPNIMVPFRDNGHLNTRQKNFNFCLSSGRISVERAIGLWKTRWRRIRDCLPMVKVEKIPEFLLATCVLHNICIMKNSTYSFTPIIRSNERGVLTNDRRSEGISKRNAILNSLPLRAI